MYCGCSMQYILQCLLESMVWTAWEGVGFSTVEEEEEEGAEEEGWGWSCISFDFERPIVYSLKMSPGDSFKVRMLMVGGDG